MAASGLITSSSSSSSPVSRPVAMMMMMRIIYYLCHPQSGPRLYANSAIIPEPSSRFFPDPSSSLSSSRFWRIRHI